MIVERAGHVKRKGPEPMFAPEAAEASEGPSVANPSARDLTE
jgi:hypothetical protein